MLSYKHSLTDLSEVGVESRREIWVIVCSYNNSPVQRKANERMCIVNDREMDDDDDVQTLLNVLNRY